MINEEQHSIKKVNISEKTYEELEQMLFHYTWESNFNRIKEEGLKTRIGTNSQTTHKN